MPARAVMATPSNSAEAIVFSIEASQQPEYITCAMPGTSLRLTPVAGTPQRSMDGPVPPIGTVHQQYVCPPGGTLSPPQLWGTGHSRGCSSPEPPDDAFFRVTKIGVEKVWSRTIDATLPLHVAPDITNYQQLAVVVRGPGQAVVTVHVESAAGAAPATVSVSAGGADSWQVSATTVEAQAAPLLAHLHAMLYGPCPSAGPCEPPANAAAPAIEERP